MKNRHLNRVLPVTVITLLLLFGCASTKYLPSSSETYPPTKETEVYIYWDKPDRPYIEMGTITVKAHSDTGMLEKFRQKAMEIGADGVLMKSIDNQLLFGTHIWFLLVSPIRAEGVAMKFRETSLEK